MHAENVVQALLPTALNMTRASTPHIVAPYTCTEIQTAGAFTQRQWRGLIGHGESSHAAVRFAQGYLEVVVEATGR